MVYQIERAYKQESDFFWLKSISRNEDKMQVTEKEWKPRRQCK